MKFIFTPQFALFGMLFLVGCLSHQNTTYQTPNTKIISDAMPSSDVSPAIFWANETLKNQTEYGGFYFVNLHFSQVPSPAFRAKLQQKGIFLNHYLGNATYSAAIPTNLAYAPLKNDLISGISIPDKTQKMTAKLQAELAQNPSEKRTIHLIYHKNLSVRPIMLALEKQGIEIENINPFFKHIRIKTNAQNFQKIATKNWLVFADNQEVIYPLGKIESDFVRSISLQNRNGLTGKNIRVGIWDEGSLNAQHPALEGRTELVETVALQYHSMTVAGILGASDIHPDYVGCAPQVALYSWDYNNSHAEVAQAIQNQDIVIGNHSYGYSVEAGGKAYGLADQFVDKLTETYSYLVNVFAVGNGGAGYKTTQNASKNTIMVGASGINDTFNGSNSSRGSTQDGRIKPDLVASGYQVTTLNQTGYGSTSGWGTSQAAPAISGLTAQLYQYYTENHPNRPPASLLKAILCNTAHDIGNLHPDYTAGFGRADGVRALRTLTENRYQINQISHGNTQKLTLYIPPNSVEAKIMLCWTDPAGTVYGNATPVLVNNLDISIKEIATGIVTLPWILDPANPANLATRGVDNLNNIEQITLQNPAAGTYEITISGTSIPVGTTQEYALTWQTEQKFIELTTPSKNEFFEPNTQPNLYWIKNGLTNAQTLEYSLDDGANWQAITGSDLNPMPAQNEFYYQWNIPNAIATKQARIRISADGISSISERFTIFGIPKNLTTQVFDNQIGLDWNAVANATHYDIFQRDKITNKWVEIASNITTNFHTVSNLQGNKTYTFAVRAKDNPNAIIGQKSVPMSATPNPSATGDLAVIQILNPTLSNVQFLRPNSTEFITIRIKNQGNGTIPAGTNLTAKFWVDNSEIASQNFTTAAINSGDEIEIKLMTSADFSIAKNYQLKVQIDWTSDPVLSNNFLVKTIEGTSQIQLTANTPNSFCTASVRLEIHGITPNYTLSNITPNLEDLSTDATPITLADHATSGALPLNFRFPFYGQWYEHFYISDEGLITFSPFVNYTAGASGQIANSESVHNFIAGVWSDFNPNFGTIRYKYFGTSPNRKTVVEFKDYPYFETTPPYTGYSSERATFQIHLHENGVIDIHYQQVSANSWTAVYTKMTAGIESPDGKNGVALPSKNYGSWAIVAPEAYRFSPDFPTWSNADAGFFTTISNTGTYTANWQQNGNPRTLSKTLTKSCGTPPIITKLQPENGATQVPKSTELELEFDENIQAGIGNLTLSNGSDNRTFSIHGNTQIKTQITNNILKISFKTALQGGTSYHILMDNGAVKNQENVPLDFAGISNAMTWNFSTKNDAPTHLFLSAVTVDNHLPDGTPIGKLTATDPNLHQNHTFSITGGTGLTQFRIQNDEILTNGVLTFASAYTLEITATDNGLPNQSFHKTFEIAMNFVTIVESPAPPPSGGGSGVLTPQLLKNQEITFDNLAFISFGNRFTLNPKTQSGQKPSLQILNGNASISGDYIYPESIGTIEILISAPSGNGYKKATIRHKIEVVKGKQVLSESQINTIPNQVWTSQQFMPDFGIQNLTFDIIEGTTLATISEGKIRLHKTGKVRLKIYLPETENYQISNSIFREFEILKTEQNIQFDNISTKTFGDADFEIRAISSSGLEIVFSKESDFIELEHHLVKIKAAGLVKIIAQQAGNDFYFPAQKSQTFRIQKAPQTIQFEAIEDKKITDKPFAIFTQSSAGLPINLQLNPNHLAEIIDGKIHLKQTGILQIIASQSGNENFEKAIEIKRTFEILPILEITDIQVINGEKILISVSQEGEISGINTLRFMLSDADGNFENNYVLYARKNADGTWIADLPDKLMTSGNYQLKILTSHPKIAPKPKAIQEVLSSKPPTFYITRNGHTLCASGDADSYVWYLNDAPILDQTESCLDLTYFENKDKLILKVQGKNGNRLGEISTGFGVNMIPITALENASVLEKNILIYPNPNDGQFTFKLMGFYAKIRIKIIHISGQIISSKFYENQVDLEEEIDLKNQSSGVYFLEIETEKGRFSKKIILK